MLRLERRIDRPDTRFATFVTLSQRDPVVVLGFPGDADGMGDLAALSTATITAGVIGRLQPPPADSTRAARLIQVSAAINPGNSGNPLFDAAGRGTRLGGVDRRAAAAARSSGTRLRGQHAPLGRNRSFLAASAGIGDDAGPAVGRGFGQGRALAARACTVHGHPARERGPSRSSRPRHRCRVRCCAV